MAQTVPTGVTWPGADGAAEGLTGDAAREG
ncbi:hypothetical protein M271_11475 [Streptomyces rapamycinicus NRRL 5491]|nr:hypothetical protein M271_11475 [Streptomyces rapamycinicus NRRL 5491]